MESIILGMGLLVFVGHLLVVFFRKTRIPDVLALIGLGMGLGPFGLDWVHTEHLGKVGGVLATVTLVVILFEGGIGTSIRDATRSAVGTIMLTALGGASTIALVGLLCHEVLGGWLNACIAGAILSGTSSAVVLPMIAALGVADRPRAVLSLESALTDVTCIVLTVGLLEAATRGDVSGAHLAGKAVSSLASAGLIGLIGGLAWMLVHERLRSVPNTRLTVIAAVFVLYGIAETLGFSGGIAALSCGMTMAHWGVRDQGSATTPTLFGRPLGRIEDDERRLFSEIAFLCKLAFFVFLGLSIPLREADLLVLATMIVVAVYLARVLIVRCAMADCCQPRDAAIAAIMAPKGLAAAVLATAVAQTGLPGSEAIRDLVYAVVLVSIVITSLLIPLIDHPPVSWLARAFYGNPGSRERSP